MKRLLLLASLLATALLAACGPTDTAPEAGQPEESLGLSRTSVFDDPDPVVAPISAADPGENETTPAAFEGAPPVIPHRIEDFLPIRREENGCVECHDTPDSIGQELATGEPTPMPPSHYEDLRDSSGSAGEALDAARWNCTMCHIPQSDATPLVANTFRP